MGVGVGVWECGCVGVGVRVGVRVVLYVYLLSSMMPHAFVCTNYVCVCVRERLCYNLLLHVCDIYTHTSLEGPL